MWAGDYTGVMNVVVLLLMMSKHTQESSWNLIADLPSCKYITVPRYHVGSNKYAVSKYSCSAIDILLLKLVVKVYFIIIIVVLVDILIVDFLVSEIWRWLHVFRVGREVHILVRGRKRNHLSFFIVLKCTWRFVWDSLQLAQHWSKKIKK